MPIAAACAPSESDFIEFGSFHSPDEKHRVVIETAPRSSFAFSSEELRIYLAGPNAGERNLLGTTTLANDGSNLKDENIRVQWVDSNTVRLCLSGSEQEDEAFVIDVATESISVGSGDCAD